LGFALYVSDQHYYAFKENAREGTNNTTKFLALLFLLKFANTNNINLKQVMGDSSLVISWMKNEIQILNINLQALAQQVKDVSSTVLQIHYQHIYKE
jgi:ribonuclease HI